MPNEPITLPEVTPSLQTGEGRITMAGLAALALPYLKQLMDKSGDTTLEVNWIGRIAITFIIARTVLKGIEFWATAHAMHAPNPPPVKPTP